MLLGATCQDRIAGPWLLWVLLFSFMLGGVSVQSGDRTPVISYFDILFFLTIAGLLAKFMLTSFRFSLPDKLVLRLSCLHIAAQLISLMFNQSDVPKSVLAIKVSIFSVAVYFIALSIIRSERDLRLTAYGLVFFATGITLLLVYFYATLWRSLFTDNATANKDLIGLAFSPNNGLAVIIAFLLPLSFGLAFSERNKARLVFILTSAILPIGLAITMSRGAFVSLVLGGLLACPMFFKTGPKLRNIALVAVLGSCVLYVLPSQLVEANVQLFKIYDMSERAQLPNSSQERYDMMQAGWQAFLDHPIVGIGANGSYLYNLQAIGDSHLTTNWIVREFSELGLLGGIPFVAMIGVLLVRDYRLCKSTSYLQSEKYLTLALYVGLLVTLINGISEATFTSQPYAVVFWIFVAIVRAKSTFVAARLAN